MLLLWFEQGDSVSLHASSLQKAIASVFVETAFRQILAQWIEPINTAGHVT
ncbi:MAG: hypothetical protein WCF10_04140 [Polyangiales bacterium]